MYCRLGTLEYMIYIITSTPSHKSSILLKSFFFMCGKNMAFGFVCIIMLHNVCDYRTLQLEI